MKKFLKLRLILTSTIVILLIAGASIVQAQDDDDRGGGSGSIWTTAEDCGVASQDLNHYTHGEVVHIHGRNFSHDHTYSWKIVGQPGGASDDPGQTVASGTIKTDGQGNFCFAAYTVMNDDGGEYKFTVGNKHDNYRVDREEASVSVSIGACSWTKEGGSLELVTISITGASVSITRAEGGSWGPYTTSKSLWLPVGHYTYTWTPTSGYRCPPNPNSGTFVVEECPPASASAAPVGCQWTEQTGAYSPVTITVSNASLTITGNGSGWGPFTSSTSIDLEPGTYNYTWTALPGYKGSGSGSFTIADCTPSFGTASIDAGACVWDESKGSTFTATITLDNASLTINGVTYVESTEIELPCGTYPYTWTANSGYQGGGSGSIDVEGCEPAKVDVIVGACDWTGASSMTPVTLNITGATLVLYETTSGSPVELDTYGPGSHSVSLGTGTFSYAWEANEDFEGSGSGTFETLDCEPGKADASVNIGACAFDEGKSLTLVSINVNGAVLTIDGEEYEENAEVKLEPGDYPYSWEAVTGYEGSGSGTIHVEGCEPASVEVILGACDWLDATSITPVTLNINGATLTLFVDNDGTLTEIDEYGPGSHTVSLPMGSYAYSWVANEDFTGSGEGTFETLDCEPGKADASIILGACTYDNEQSLTLVSVFLNGAVLTIDGQEFFENAELKLAPGEYAYSWVAASKEFEGSGEGVLVVAACDPKGGEDPSPDVAAGGSGPSLIVTLTPALLTVAGVAIAWVLIKHRIKNI